MGFCAQKHSGSNGEKRIRLDSARVSSYCISLGLGSWEQVLHILDIPGYDAGRALCASYPPSLIPRRALCASYPPLVYTPGTCLPPLVYTRVHASLPPWENGTHSAHQYPTHHGRMVPTLRISTTPTMGEWCTLCASSLYPPWENGAHSAHRLSLTHGRMVHTLRIVSHLHGRMVYTLRSMPPRL